MTFVLPFGAAARRGQAVQIGTHLHDHPQRVVVIASLGWSLINFRLQLLRRIKAQGHELLVLAPDIDDETALRFLAEDIRFAEIPMARTGVNPLADLVTFVALLRMLRSEGATLVLPYTMKPILYGTLAARVIGARATPLFTGLGYAFSEPNPVGRRRYIRNVAIWLHRLALRGVDLAFCYNDAEEEDMRRFTLVPPETRIVRMNGSGIDTALFQPSPPPVGPIRFLFIGRLLKSKGVELLVEAARRLRAEGHDFRLCLLGPSDSNPDAISAATLAEWSKDSLIELAGETRDVRPWLQGSSVLVLPTMLREGVPRVILEAMAMGRAVITTDAPGCGETIRHDISGLVVPAGNVPALAAAMRRFLDDPRLAIMMGEAARAQVVVTNDVHDVNRRLLTSIGLEPLPEGGA